MRALLGIIIWISFSIAGVLAAENRSVMVHLFEWPWDDVGRECKEVLGPAGFAAVQVSPPGEHAVFDFAPWWQRYQPVSYRIESRSGTREEFRAMVAACAEAGVAIYVDAILNHMSFKDAGTGSSGSEHTRYNYPGIYGNQDFHSCRRGIDRPWDRWEVQHCDLATAPDLATGSPYVRQVLSAYLQDLVDLGVKGFRLDGAKHMPAGDIAAILASVSPRPYVFQEVIDFGFETVSATEYFSTGDVTEFRFSNLIAHTFRSGKLADLHNFEARNYLMPYDKAVVFIDNHDNQRGHGAPDHAISFRDGKLHELANLFMLAQPYGYPRLMSSYEFSDGDEGPPSIDGQTNKVLKRDGTCSSGWVCEHRKKAILGMIRFHNETLGAQMTRWWSNGNDQIAFSREKQGFFALNREELGKLTGKLETDLPTGKYCDLITGFKVNDICTGETLVVNREGFISIDISASSAVGTTLSQKLDPQY